MIEECAATDNHIFLHDKMREILLNEASIKELALQIVQQQPSVWYFYAVVIALNVVLGAICVYLIKYVGKRGEQAAIKADFNEILRQIKKTTEVSEQVRSAVSHADWVDREWKTIRRIKLEELVNSADSVKDWLADMLSAYSDILNEKKFSDERKIENKRIRFSSSPAGKISTISKLYFSDTQTLLIKKCDCLLVESATMQLLVSNASKESLEKNQHIPPAEFGWDTQYLVLIKLIDEIKAEATKIMEVYLWAK